MSGTTKVFSSIKDIELIPTESLKELMSNVKKHWDDTYSPTTAATWAHHYNCAEEELIKRGVL